MRDDSIRAEQQRELRRQAALEDVRILEEFGDVDPDLDPLLEWTMKDIVIED